MKLKWFGFALILWQMLSMVPVQAEEIRVPLYQLYPVDAIDLKCVEANYDVSLPIPSRWKVNSAKIEFGYTNSASLIRQNSQLVVRLNGTPLAQIKLDPNAPEGNAEVDLPSLILQSGYNNLSFSVTQHYAKQCELPCVPELWTRLKLDQAMVTIDYDLRDVPTELSAITNFMFDGKSFVNNKTHIITGNKSKDMLSMAGAVASGIALRYDYQAAEFSTSDDLVNDIDNVLIGTSEFVTQFLGEREIDVNIDAPFLQIMHLPVKKTLETGEEVWSTDPTRALLVISAPDLEQLRLAVESFDVMSLPFPDSEQMRVYEFNLPEIGLYSGKEMVIPEQKYPFSKLNYRTTTIRGFSAGEESINFRVPPDFHIKPNQYVTVSLNFAYGAGYRIDSVLNVLINGFNVASIHLDNPRGGLVSDYQLSLPTYLFSAGVNQLSFQPVLTPLITENCAFIHQENLFLTMFDSSSITFPKMPHRVEMPRLDLMFVNGFPYTRWPDGHDAMIHLPVADNDSIAAALNMVGLLSQKNGYPLLGIEISPDDPAGYQGELLVMGALDNLPQVLLDDAPLQRGEYFTIPYPVFKSFDAKQGLAYSTQDSDFSVNKAMMMQFQSPWKAGRSVVMMTGKTSGTVEHLSRALLRPAVQSGIEGDLNLIDFVAKENVENEWRYVVNSVKTDKTYITGKGGQATAVDSYLSTNPVAFWAVAISVIFLISVLTYLLMKRYRARRMQE